VTRGGTQDHTHAGRRARVLIIDDDRTFRIALARLVLSFGYDVVTAATGADGLTVAATAAPDVICLDLRMPGLSGEEVLKRLVSRDSAVAVIVVTADGNAQVASRLRSDGAFDVILKPLEPETLKASLEAAVRTRQARARLT
jgi:FixJ family two-component response regulator